MRNVFAVIFGWIMVIITIPVFIAYAIIMTLIKALMKFIYAICRGMKEMISVFKAKNCEEMEAHLKFFIYF